MTAPFIMVAPNGARRGKADHTALPVTLPEIIRTAADCQKAGAHGLHLHIRDKSGAHSLDGGLYREALSELRRVLPTFKIQITTEAAGMFDVPAQLACLQQVRPAWASLAIGEIAREPELGDHIYGTCAEHGTKVQHILYDTKDYALLKDWQTRGIIRPEQTDVLFVLGRYLRDRSSRPADLDPFLACHQGDARWMLCAFGAGEHDCLRYAAEHGGDLRVGFENSLVGPDGQTWPDCAASVAALVSALNSSAGLSHLSQSLPIGG